MIHCIEAQYRSDRHGNLYWCPILRPGSGKYYATYTNKKVALGVLAKLQSNESLKWDVGIMGNDYPTKFRLISYKGA